MKLSTRQQALLTVSVYALIMLIAFMIYKTLLYVFVFSLVSILVVNFILRNLVKLKVPYTLSIILSLVIYFGVLIYAIITSFQRHYQLTLFMDSCNRYWIPNIGKTIYRAIHPYRIR